MNWQGSWEPIQPWLSLISRDKPEDDGFQIVNNKKKGKKKEENKERLVMDIDDEWEEIRAEGIVDSGA